MKFLTLVILISAGSFFSCLAQSAKFESKFNFGLEAGLPVGKASKSYNYAIGGSLKYEYLAGENFYLTVSAGYTSFQFSDNFKQLFLQSGSSKSAYGFVPLKIGGKYYVNKSFFTELQLGNTFLTETDGGQAVTFAPGAGFSFSNNLELGLRYEGWLKDGLISQYSLRVAYRFKL